MLHWIEIIGEAARGVNDKVRDGHPEVPWRVISDMRNRVTHGYFDIDLDVVWNTVTRDLPKLKESVTRIRAELDSEAENSPEEWCFRLLQRPSARPVLELQSRITRGVADATTR